MQKRNHQNVDKCSSDGNVCLPKCKGDNWLIDTSIVTEIIIERLKLRVTGVT